VTLGALALTLAGCPSTPHTACRSHDDCRSLAQGYCARAEVCTRECAGPADCLTGSACVDEGRRQVCLATCTLDADCLTGFGCQPREDAGVCRLLQPLEPPPN
jgi:hypothetical protein